MNSFYLKALGVGLLGSTGVAVLGNAWKNYFPDKINFAGMDDPLWGGLLVINAVLLAYSMDEPPQRGGAFGINYQKADIYANGAYTSAGVIFLLIGISTLVVAQQAEEAVPLAWFCYVAMAGTGAYMTAKGVFNLYHNIDSNELVNKRYSKIVEHEEKEFRLQAKPRLEAKWTKLKAENPPESSWFSNFGWF